MDSSFVVIRDHVGQVDERLVITEDEIAYQASNWMTPQPLLNELKQPLFRGIDCWAEMDTPHYHALLALQIGLCADHQDHPGKLHLVLKGLRATLASLIFEISARIDGEITQLVIHRITDAKIEIEMSATLMSLELPPHNGGLKVVVDNSGK